MSWNCLNIFNVSNVIMNLFIKLDIFIVSLVYNEPTALNKKKLIKGIIEPTKQ